MRVLFLRRKQSPWLLVTDFQSSSLMIVTPIGPSFTSHHTVLSYDDPFRKKRGVDEVLHNACNVSGYKCVLVGVYPMRYTES